VQVEAQYRTLAAHRCNRRRQHFAHIGIPRVHICEPILHHHRDAEIRAAGLENAQRGCGQDAVAERSEAYHGHRRSLGQFLEYSGH
jgi:hypothetical protein